MTIDTNSDIGTIVRGLDGVLMPGLDAVDLLDRTVEASIAWTAAVEGGVVLADRAGDLHIAASSAERTADAEEAQLGTSEGPCFDCVHAGAQINVPDVRSHAEEWPEFTRTAVERGFGGVHAAPLWLADRVVGSLCLFSSGTRGFTDRDLVVIQLLAGLATGALVQRAADRGVDLEAEVAATLEARVLIEQAKGAVSYREGVSIDAAFALIRQRARERSHRLRDVAERIVAGGTALA